MRQSSVSLSQRQTGRSPTTVGSLSKYHVGRLRHALQHVEPYFHEVVPLLDCLHPERAVAQQLVILPRGLAATDGFRPLQTRTRGPRLCA